MEEAEFLIPHSIDELLEFAEKQYSVQDVSEPVQIREQYTGKKKYFCLFSMFTFCIALFKIFSPGLRLTLSGDVDDFIFGKFDLLYSCIKHFPLLSPKVTHEVWELVLKGLKLKLYWQLCDLNLNYFSSFWTSEFQP
jgi:hypothetical protein